MTQEEFRNTWLPLSDALYRVAFYMLEDEADAKDVVQDLYVKLLAKSPEDVRNPKAYAITMLRNMGLTLRSSFTPIISETEWSRVICLMERPWRR